MISLQATPLSSLLQHCLILSLPIPLSVSPLLPTTTLSLLSLPATSCFPSPPHSPSQPPLALPPLPLSLPATSCSPSPPHSPSQPPLCSGWLARSRRFSKWREWGEDSSSC
ncbi:hypothetical protein Pcinc_021526 [Petrolisthes cinctipes]|uniref:Uncharacterized protein n=1 Tax=Petrolisthes cinctipes TaxID=88211 RepID=A0AAE1FFT3_PETCI|nr:hypothetical protein Pcinc_021526 [Petrolisthes cinctipes]